MQTLKTFTADDLVPENWHARYGIGSLQALNNAIIDYGERTVMAYRVIKYGPLRRVALCHLDAQLEVVPGSHRLLSEAISHPNQNHQDARLFRFRGRLYVYMNTSARPGSPEFLIVEIDPDTLEPRGPVRPMVTTGPRQLVEKNWVLFEADERVWAVYSTSPHIVMSVDLDDNAAVVECRPIYRTEWDISFYERRYGQMRGGALPIYIGDEMLSITHSSHLLPRPWRWYARFVRRHGWYRYLGAVYAFDPQPPFAPRWCAAAPFLVPQPLKRFAAHRVDRRVENSVFPLGALHRDGRLLISFGAQEEYCMLDEYALAEIKRNAVDPKVRAR